MENQPGFYMRQPCPGSNGSGLLLLKTVESAKGFGHLVDKTMAIQEGDYFRWMRYGNWYSRTTAKLVPYLDEGLEVMT